MVRRVPSCLLFAFDVARSAILLVGGDKSRDWKGWYEKNIPVADDRFDKHQTRLAAKGAKKATAKTPKTAKITKGKRP